MSDISLKTVIVAANAIAAKLNDTSNISNISDEEYNDLYNAWDELTLKIISINGLAWVTENMECVVR